MAAQMTNGRARGGKSRGSEKEFRNPLWRHTPACGIGIGIPKRLGQEGFRLLVVPLELKAPQAEGPLLDHVDFLLLRRPPEELARIRFVNQPPFRPLGKKEFQSENFIIISDRLS